MNRDERIKQRAVDYARGQFVPDEEHPLPFENPLANAFYEGAYYADHLTKSPWVSVNDGLPEEGEKVLIYYPIDGGKILFATRGHVDMFTTLDRNGFPLIIKTKEHDYLNTEKISATHWMYVPEPKD